MKYSVKGDGTSLTVKVQDVGDRQRKLLEVLQECAAGRCSCPTPQYAKLESMNVVPGNHQVHIELKAKGRPDHQPV